MKTKNLWEKNKIRTWGAKILKCIGTFFICSLILYNILYVANNVFRNKKYVQIFGIYISTEKEKSMEPIIQKNTLIIGIKCRDLKQGEIIGYDIDNSIKYHRLAKIQVQNGKTTYITKAEQNYREDFEEKKKEDIKSEIVLKIPVIGWIFRIFESKITTVIIVIGLGLRFSYYNYKNELTKQRKNKRETATKKNK